ncbi:Uncharacterised protein [Chryseobacterium carnipullorum]|uniref:Uncharacterized protein n=1 Tax=Chryseobacterium carnipullorum TaxID=1124835 RepID=A0A376DU83_CHRCU|nr:Uncharacterised protein [Chryseobacterium carnipullorum]
MSPEMKSLTEVYRQNRIEKSACIKYFKVLTVGNYPKELQTKNTRHKLKDRSAPEKDYFFSSTKRSQTLTCKNSAILKNTSIEG